MHRSYVNIFSRSIHFYLYTPGDGQNQLQGGIFGIFFLKVPLQKWCSKNFFPKFFFSKLDLNQIFRCLRYFSSDFEKKKSFSKYFFRIFKFFDLTFFCRFFTILGCFFEGTSPEMVLKKIFSDIFFFKT